MKISQVTRDAILSKTKNHNFGADGFCACGMHWTDWRQNDLCTLKLTTSEKIKVRACSIISKEHPEWGTWGVKEDRGTYFEILGSAGSRVLDKSEANEFWEVVTK